MTSTWTNGLGEGSAPPNWVREHDGSHYCLACRRERAIEIALEEAGEVGIEARAKLRSQAVVEFEIAARPRAHRGRDRQGRPHIDPGRA